MHCNDALRVANLTAMQVIDGVGENRRPVPPPVGSLFGGIPDMRLLHAAVPFGLLPSAALMLSGCSSSHGPTQPWPGGGASRGDGYRRT